MVCQQLVGRHEYADHCRDSFWVVSDVPFASTTTSLGPFLLIPRHQNTRWWRFKPSGVDMTVQHRMRDLMLSVLIVASLLAVTLTPAVQAVAIDSR